MKIYTKTGDAGETSLLGGGRVKKSHPRLDAYGTVDEVNSCLGVVRAFLTSIKAQANLEVFAQNLDSELQRIQSLLFDLGSQLACVDAKLAQSLPPLEPGAIESFERQIDEMQSRLPELKNFILPGGSVVGAHLHLARTICRRAERLVSQLSETETINPLLVVFLNRLGDYLFVMARYANQQQGHSDILWKPQ